MDLAESLTGTMPAELLNKLFAPLQVVPMLSPSSSAPSSASSASPPLADGRKRPSSPVETQAKKARLSPETPSSTSEKQEGDDSNESTEFQRNLSSGGPVSEETVFCQVPGRLAILNANTKYAVTVGEIKRRLGNPERLNTSVMGGILRRAKAKNGGKELRELLEGMGLDLPMGKRKAIAMTLFTPMVEGEALHLAKDFDTLCNGEFPVEIISDQLLEHIQGEKREKRNKLETTSSMLNELKSLLMMDRSPLLDSKEEVVLPKDVQDSLTHFSMCTHGFGVPALLAALNVIIKVVDASANKITDVDQNQLAWGAFYALASLMQQQAAQNQLPVVAPPAPANSQSP